MPTFDRPWIGTVIGYSCINRRQLVKPSSARLAAVMLTLARSAGPLLQRRQGWVGAGSLRLLVAGPARDHR
jgi:hypothetical protein